MRAVVDPNVLISAVITPSGVTGQVARAALSRRFELVTCPRLIEELETVLRRPRFRQYLSIDEADDYVTSIEGVAHDADDPADPEALSRDPDDDYLIALTREAPADRLVTGDQDLLELEKPPVPIVSPRALLDDLEARS